MDSWPVKIASALTQKLPGGKSHRKMLPPGRELEPSHGVQGEVRQSGVLLLLFPSDAELFLCLIKRPSTMKDHAGQIGFPGGKCEQDDANPLQTALRESMEEIGIQPTHVEILGALSPLYISVSRFLIHPFVAWSHSKPRFNLCSGEVEKLLLFPFLQLLKGLHPVATGVETHSGRLMAPSLIHEGEIIWGATAMILSEFADVMEAVSGEFRYK